MKEKILEIYTDASGDNKNGLGILFINPDETERQYSYKVNKKIFYSIIHNKYMTKKDVIIDITQLEILAIYIAIKELKRYSRTYNKIILYSDNLTSIDFLNKNYIKKNKSKSRNSVIEMVILIKSLLKEYDIDIDFRWIKAHCGVYGNELADRLARVGARRRIFYDLNTFNIKNIQKSLFDTKKVVWRKMKEKDDFETIYLKIA